MSRATELRATFDQVPELYDRARPDYPQQIFDDLITLAALPPAARIVEVGCGTGQATLPLATRGYAVTCVELGEQLAAVARRKLAAFSSVEVINADFETWRPRRGDFDAIVAFTAFHWLTPEARYTRTAELLRERGKLAVVATSHVQPADGDSFFIQVQEDYEAVVPDDPSTKAAAGGPPAPDAVADIGDEIAASGQFRNVAARRYLWDVVYSADDYIALLNTFSGQRALVEETRERLFSLIRRRIQARPHGEVRKTYLAVLNVAERL